MKLGIPPWAPVQVVVVSMNRPSSSNIEWNLLSLLNKLNKWLSNDTSNREVATFVDQLGSLSRLSGSTQCYGRPYRLM